MNTNSLAAEREHLSVLPTTADFEAEFRLVCATIKLSQP